MDVLFGNVWGDFSAMEATNLETIRNVFRYFNTNSYVAENIAQIGLTIEVRLRAQNRSTLHQLTYSPAFHFI